MKDSTVVKNKDSLQLTPHDVALLEDLLSNGVVYFDSIKFGNKEFCKKLLDYTGPKTDSSWFFNYLNAHDGMTVDSYSDNIQLTPEEEQLLFYKFNYLKKKVNSLAKLNEPTTYNDLIKYYNEAEAVKEKIVSVNLAYVIKTANENTFINIDFSEAISEGSLALSKTVDKFDVDQGYKFSTYLHSSITKAFIKLNKINSKHSNSVEYDPAMHEPVDSNSHDVESRELFALISDLIEGIDSPLTPEQAFVLEKKYTYGLTLEEIGKLMDPVKTKGQVFYVEKVAKEKLRKALDDLL